MLGKFIVISAAIIFIIAIMFMVYLEAKCLKDYDCKPSGPCWWWYGSKENGYWEKDEDCGL